MSLKGNVQVMVGIKDDGDEMNIHIPQGDAEKAEVTEFMLTPHHMVSAQNNSTIIALIQDALAGSFLLTRKNTFVGWDDFCDACSSADIPTSKVFETLAKAHKHYPEYIELFECKDKQGNKIMGGRPKKNNKKTYSPSCRNVTFDKKKDVVHHAKCASLRKGKCQVHTEVSDGFVELPGRLLFSVLFPESFCYDKKDVHIEDGVILPDSDPLGKADLGVKAGNSIIHVLWLERSEFVAQEFVQNCQALIYRWYTRRNLSIGTEDCQLTEEGKKEVDREMANARVKCAMEIKSGKSGDELESSITGILNSVISLGQNLTKKHIFGGEDNGFAVAIVSGAKGGFINLSQALAVVGQQNVEGARIKMLISGGQRCLPHFEFNANGADERGFISSSYYMGLTAIEAFFAAMGGREGIIDTAVKTAESGYLQRRLGFILGSLILNILGVIAKSNGKIVEFLYGGDGFNAAKLTNVGDILLFVDPARVAREITVSSSGVPKKLTEEELEKIVEVLQYNASPSTQRIAEELRKVVKKLLRPVLFAGSVELLRDKLFRLFMRAIAPYGHPVGYEATCSIGEVQTQLTLNSFRLSGVGEKAVLTGVPRFRELMVASERQKHSSCTVAVECLSFDVFDEESKRKGLKIAEEQRKVFEYRKVGDFVGGTPELRYFFGKEQEFSLETNASVFVEEEMLQYQPQWWVNFYLGMTGQTLPGYDEDADECVWVIELKVKKDMLYKYRMTLKELAQSVAEGGDVACIPSPNCELTLLVYPDYQRDVSEALQKLAKKKDLKSVFNENNVNYFFARDIVVPFVLEKRACGIEGIDRIFALHDKKNGKMMLDTEGSNFSKILNLPGVIAEETTSDDLHQVLGVLGIEAARSVLLAEFKKVMSGGSYVNERHIALLVNAMTRDGKFCPVSRDGVERSIGPLEVCSFEKIIDNFYISAQFGEVDHMKSTTSAIFMGNAANAGTAAVHVERKQVVQEQAMQTGSLLPLVLKEVEDEMRRLFVLPCQ
ncbi:DNA-directed RNA polymerase subunit alpha [Brazilian marseillevirus]|uniref:DNA-directed RNA polymerase subunit alpha n=1 Tax=Brazilian marseillevirus TaxID=1813599 RepID=UPI0007847D0A|nr:DNA-directed RNA polymerase subunit alpha [Brazilian marseillevirus]AMQ10538.1 DNA-directed RNA polymerase subunit alpha [Brazilian marseillevirus]